MTSLGGLKQSKRLASAVESTSDELLHASYDSKWMAMSATTQVVDFQLNGPLNALSMSPDGSDQVVVAGREVQRNQVSEVLNLRAGARLNLNASSNDVKWGTPSCKNLIVTAATNGAIVIWDLNKTSGQKQDRVIVEHQRAVNRICFNSNEPAMLLSASQDGTMRLWDLRSPGVAKFVFEGQSESVRDVQFNPVNPTEFAAAFENGTIQKWDIRNPSLFERKFNAHNGLALSIDWHASGRYLASGGRDRMIKFWDMYSDSRKPFHYIQTIASLARVQWRQMIRLSTANSLPLEQNSFHIASCSLLSDSRIHIWNLERPYMPFYSFEEHSNVTTGFVWADSQTLYSVGKDCMFLVHRMPTGDTGGTGFVPGETMSSVALKWNMMSDIAWSVKQLPLDDSTTDDHTLTGNSNVLASLSLTAQKTLQGSTSKESLHRMFAQHDLPSNAVTWSGSNIPNNFASILANLGNDDYNVHNTVSEKSLTRTEMDEQETKPTTTMAYFSRKLPRRSQNVSNARQNEIVLNLFNPSTVQYYGVSDSKTFDSYYFVLFANLCRVPRYQDESYDDNAVMEIEKCCFDNSEIANQLGRLHMGKLWLLLSSLCKNVLCSEKPIDSWSPAAVLGKTLLYLASEGDYQTCVVVYLMFQPALKQFSTMAEEWFHTYIDILRRFQMWTIATEIIRSAPFASVRRLNQESTTMHTSCNRCFKPLLNAKHGFWACERCQMLLNPCSICHLTVKSSYVWCQGCSHGGHLEHISEWFLYNDECPTGCGHRCSKQNLMK